MSAAPRFSFTDAPELAAPPSGLKSLERSQAEVDAILAKPAEKRLADNALNPSEWHRMDGTHPSQDDRPIEERRAVGDRLQRYHAARLAGKTRAEAGREAGYRWSTKGSIDVCGLALDLTLGIPVKRKPRRNPRTAAQQFVDRYCNSEDAP